MCRSERAALTAALALTILLTTATLRAAPRFTPAIKLPPPSSLSLPNGLKVLLQPDPTAHGRAAVLMRYAVGSSDDPPGHAGLAHVVEHLTFRGSRHLKPLEPLTLLERAGATSMNGEVRRHETLYYSVLPSRQLETALWIESERMAFTLERFNEEHLELERRIVANELLQRDGPYRAFSNHIDEVIYPENHPYHPRERPVADSLAIELSDAQWFMQRWYRPDNATLVLVGDFDTAETTALIRRYFEPVVAPRAALPRRSVAVPRPAGFKRVHVTAPVSRSQMRFVWVRPAADKKERQSLTLDMLAFILRQRLRRALVWQSAAARSATAVHDGSKWQSRFEVEVGLFPDADPPKIEQRILSIVRKISERPISRTELAEAKSALATAIVFQADKLLGRALRLAQEEPSLNEALARVSAVTEADITAAANKLLAARKPVVALLSKSRSTVVRARVVDDWEAD